MAVYHTLVDDLLARGYESITVLDISQAAIDANRKRVGRASDRVHWLVAVGHEERHIRDEDGG